MVAKDPTVTHYRIRMEPDEDAESPRTWDNVGTMVCWHRRHTLGDEQPTESADDYLCALARGDAEFDRIDVNFDKLISGGAADAVARYRLKWLEARETALHASFVILPLYLYDHSGITMNTTGFSCPWDSGRVGFIYCSLFEAQVEFDTVGNPEGFAALVDHMGKTMTLRELVKLQLEGEVETYDQFLTGEVYCWYVENCEKEADEEPEEDDWQLLDSACGRFGHEHAKQEARQALEQSKQEAAVLT
jgi:hypothetical protein